MRHSYQLPQVLSHPMSSINLHLGDLIARHIELVYVVHVVIYAAILGFLGIVILLLFKYLGECNGETDDEREPTLRESTETDPLMPENVVKLAYGTIEDDMESGTSSSFGDLYDVKICAICYDMPRNCFFVPCGHCITCHDCALRIKDEENKLCPICRRLIKKVRKLIIPDNLTSVTGSPIHRMAP